MEFKYIVCYKDIRLIDPNKEIAIKTARIDLWTRDFEKNNSPYVTIVDYNIV